MTTRLMTSAAFLIVALAPAAASAQARPYAKLALSIGQGYDDNLFASPASGDPQSDLVTRFGPLFEAGTMSPVVAFVARYGFDAERYVSQVQLNDMFARQEALVDLHYRLVPRFALRNDASFLDTQTPRELNEVSLIAAGRARARRFRAHSGAEYDANAVMKVNADYEFAEDSLVGGLATTTQSARTGLAYHPSPRNTYRTSYRFSRVGFDDGTTMMIAVITGGWSRTITPSVSFEIDAGPRLSSGTIRPEIAAQLKRRLRRGEISVAYFNSEETVLGEVGTVEVHRLLSTFSYRPTRAITVTTTPAIVRSFQSGLPVTVYELDGDLTIQASKKVSVVVFGRLGRQNGTFGGAPDMIPLRGVGVRSIVTFE